MEKRENNIGRWLAVCGFLYLSFITWLYALFAKDALYMLSYIALFMACGVIVSPLLLKLDNRVKIAIIAALGIIIVAGILIFAPVTLGTMVSQFISLIKVAYTVFRAAFVVIIFINVCLIILLSWLCAPYWFWF